MPIPETNSRKITQRLEREGWILKEGGEHSIYKHPDRPGVRIVVPRHREVSTGVALSIAKLADWK
ncbi:MAG: type II toxin-antitoxin system HicA family toxin [Hyphomicrobium sp.]